MQFGVIVRDGGNEAELLVHGEVDVATAPMMGTTLSAAVARHPFVVVDLAQVPFIDSTGIGTLIDVANEPAQPVATSTFERFDRTSNARSPSWVSTASSSCYPASCDGRDGSGAETSTIRWP
jgi:ABC-type transporter Mla MlaB component